MEYEIGQTWVGETEIRVVQARPLGLVLFLRLGTAGALRAREDHATYIPYGPAFCSAHAFDVWVRQQRASLEDPHDYTTRG